MPITTVKVQEDLTAAIPVGPQGSHQRVIVRYLPQPRMDRLRKKSQARTFNKKSHRLEMEVDTDKFAKFFLEEALVSFEGVTWSTLLNELLELQSESDDGTKLRFEVTGDLSVPIPESDMAQAREFFLLYGRASAQGMILRAATDDFDAALEAQRKVEEGN